MSTSALNTNTYCTWFPQESKNTLSERKKQFKYKVCKCLPNLETTLLAMWTILFTSCKKRLWKFESPKLISLKFAMTLTKSQTIRFFHFNGIHFEPLGRERLDRCQLELIHDDPPFLILPFKFDQRTSHISHESFEVWVQVSKKGWRWKKGRWGEESWDSGGQGEK